MTKPVFSHVFGLQYLDFEENSNCHLPRRLNQDYKYLHARQIPYQNHT